MDSWLSFTLLEQQEQWAITHPYVSTSMMEQETQNVYGMTHYQWFMVLKKIKIQLHTWTTGTMSNHTSICKYKYNGVRDTECLQYDTLTMVYGAPLLEQDENTMNGEKWSKSQKDGNKLQHLGLQLTDSTHEQTGKWWTECAFISKDHSNTGPSCSHSDNDGVCNRWWVKYGQVRMHLQVLPCSVNIKETKEQLTV